MAIELGGILTSYIDVRNLGKWLFYSEYRDIAISGLHSRETQYPIPIAVRPLAE